MVLTLVIFSNKRERLTVVRANDRQYLSILGVSLLLMSVNNKFSNHLRTYAQFCLESCKIHSRSVFDHFDPSSKSNRCTRVRVEGTKIMSRFMSDSISKSHAGHFRPGGSRVGQQKWHLCKSCRFPIMDDGIWILQRLEMMLRIFPKLLRNPFIHS